MVLYNEKKNILVFNLFTLLLVLLFLILVIFYNDIEKIEIQKYLYKIHQNNILLKEKFINLINPNYNVNISHKNIIILENFLNERFFEYLKNQFYNKMFESKNFLVRKGTGISFYNLHKSEEYSGFLEIYYSNETLNVLSNILKKNIQRTPLSDNNACSLLIYNNAGDYIDWHKDYSNYYGDRYVVLLSIINNDKDKNCCSENEFIYMEEDNNINKIKLSPNNLIIFKGSEILHKSTAIGDGEQRILLSMTFCDICQEKKNISYNIYEAIKNNILYI